MSAHRSIREDQAAAEEIAAKISAVAADFDLAVARAGRALQRMDLLGATPNRLLAVRDAMQAVAAAASKLRAEGLLLGDDQQRLL